jgi:hypothetical protein
MGTLIIFSLGFGLAIMAVSNTTPSGPMGLAVAA